MSYTTNRWHTFTKHCFVALRCLPPPIPSPPRCRCNRQQQPCNPPPPSRFRVPIPLQIRHTLRRLCNSLVCQVIYVIYRKDSTHDPWPPPPLPPLRGQPWSSHSTSWSRGLGSTSEATNHGPPQQSNGQVPLAHVADKTTTHQQTITTNSSQKHCNYKHNGHAQQRRRQHTHHKNSSNNKPRATNNKFRSNGQPWHSSHNCNNSNDN